MIIIIVVVVIIIIILKAAEAQEALEEESLAKVEAEVREELRQALAGDEVKLFACEIYLVLLNKIFLLLLFLVDFWFICDWGDSWRMWRQKKWRFLRKTGKMFLMSLRRRVLTYWYVSFHLKDADFIIPSTYQSTLHYSLLKVFAINFHYRHRFRTIRASLPSCSPTEYLGVLNDV